MRWVAAAGVLVLLAPSPAATQPEETAPVYVDVTDAAGLDWGVHELALRGWNLVETMGGKVGVDGVEPRGSCFWFTVPARVRPESASGQ